MPPRPKRMNKEWIEDLESQTSQLHGLADGLARLTERVDGIEMEKNNVASATKVLSKDFRAMVEALQAKLGDLSVKTRLGSDEKFKASSLPCKRKFINRQVYVAIDSKKANVLIVVVLGFVICSFVAISVSGYFIYKERVYRYRRLLGNGNLGLREELTLQMFSYNELVKATDGFKEELGRGSFGAVYKGVLSRGSKLVAVKRLEKVVEEGEREFRAEMRAIGRSHHRNLVRLFGYCAEDSKRLLVYEYMSNGSLADSLFKAERRPEWDERISDFGLAKLLMPNQTRTFTGVRGTRGYLAPEWQKNTPISVKADIYSFGVVLLEIICCRKNLELDKLVGGEEVEKTTLETMVMVGLWCIQDEPHLRPSVKNVILMLEGIMDVPVPPSPTPCS
ncbi:hypothetical protein HHK36_009288 [Tetracentron sinense]|uniref:non-specific serine/threonine protein kinase n=1 Tax=Tetracentron sinense TaxID=13715 RepID=A0A835DHC4_TETSI|nr:hypothetical protein HHK36_009288 [Tetracentron sinense]